MKIIYKIAFKYFRRKGRSTLLITIVTVAVLPLHLWLLSSAVGLKVFYGIYRYANLSFTNSY